MILKYGCAKLRGIEEQDAELLLDMMNDPYIESMTVDTHFPISMLSQKKWIQNFVNTETDVRLMIELSNGKTIGMLILSGINYHNRTASFAFKKYADKEDRMPNDIFDASIALFDYIFNQLGLNCIYTRTLPYNEKSLALQQKLGFVQEGILRQRVFRNGVYSDLISSSLIRDDYLKIKKDYELLKKE